MGRSDPARGRRGNPVRTRLLPAALAAVQDGGSTARISGSKFIDNNNYGAASSSSTGGVTSLTVSHSVAGNSVWGFLAEALTGTANARLYVTDSVMDSGEASARARRSPRPAARRWAP